LIGELMLNLAPEVKFGTGPTAAVSFFCPNRAKKLIADSGDTYAHFTLNADASNKICLKVDLLYSLLLYV
jgi:hypothetical protein